jgi:exodeoxyribonuclease VII large subunit
VMDAGEAATHAGLLLHFRDGTLQVAPADGPMPVAAAPVAATAPRAKAKRATPVKQQDDLFGGS